MAGKRECIPNDSKSFTRLISHSSVHLYAYLIHMSKVCATCELLKKSFLMRKSLFRLCILVEETVSSTFILLDSVLNNLCFVFFMKHTRSHPLGRQQDA